MNFCSPARLWLSINSAVSSLHWIVTLLNFALNPHARQEPDFNNEGTDPASRLKKRIRFQCPETYGSFGPQQPMNPRLRDAAATSIAKPRKKRTKTDTYGHVISANEIQGFSEQDTREARVWYFTETGKWHDEDLEDWGRWIKQWVEKSMAERVRLAIAKESFSISLRLIMKRKRRAKRSGDQKRGGERTYRKDSEGTRTRKEAKRFIYNAKMSDGGSLGHEQSGERMEGSSTTQAIPKYGIRVDITNLPPEMRRSAIYRALQPR
ncbi:MAG: hypothetical protein Q9212_001608 [Teloschistes hypoglaucus]